MAYPACWGVSEGANVISPDSEFIFYGVLDCNLIPFTAFVFLGLHWRIDPARLGLTMRSYDDPIVNYRSTYMAGGGVLAEKKDTATNGQQ